MENVPKIERNFVRSKITNFRDATRIFPSYYTI